MEIKSLAFEPGGNIPAKYTCDGENINPPLIFTDVPGEARSLALIIDDPDSPTGTWTHWVVWNISRMAEEIEEDEIPQGALEGTTSFGDTGYGGPCPHNGTHRYFFKVYALDVQLNLSPGADKEEVEDAMQDHIIEKAELIGLYTREEKKNG